MAANCKNKFCYPEETGCNNGHHNLAECLHYNNNESINSSSTIVDEASYYHIPWTGNSLGLQDINIISAKSKLKIFGVIGSASSGKTTFLAALYCLIRHGGTLDGYSFAGSMTLTGWENIAWYLSWKSNGEIQFPPHTSHNSGRIPGLLHFTLRDKNGDLHEIVFTDAPGEWFTRWSINREDPSAEGARWVYQKADAFLLFGDCETLAGPERGKARYEIRQIAERMKEQINTRQIAFIWSKSDYSISPELKSSIEGYITNTQNKNFKSFEVSVLNENEDLQQNILKSIDWLLKENSDPQLIQPFISSKSNDPFFAIR